MTYCPHCRVTIITDRPNRCGDPACKSPVAVSEVTPGNAMFIPRLEWVAPMGGWKL